MSEPKKRGRPVADPDKGARVRLHGCWVNADTKRLLKASGLSQGRAIDEAVDLTFGHLDDDSKTDS